MPCLYVSDNRTHFCSFITCTKAFKTADALKMHMMFHLDEKPLKCEHCDYSCRQKSSIRFHMKKTHPELVPPKDLNLKTSVKKKSKSSASKKTENNSDGKVDPDATMKAVEGEDTVSGVKDHAMSLEACERLGFVDDKQTAQSDSLEYANRDKEKLDLPLLTLPSKDSFDNPVSVSTPIKSDDSVPFSNKKTSKSSNQKQSDIRNTTNEKKGGGTLSSSNEKSSKKSASIDIPPLSRAILSELPPRKAKKTDMYEFQSEEESGDEMQPGLYFGLLKNNSKIKQTSYKFYFLECFGRNPISWDLG